ncbi:MAG: hypothetical protein ABR500_01845 [Dermatophilaceae bacterium]|nr:hypothetical protein [Intrasporangiaceae bacterium]
MTRPARLVAVAGSAGLLAFQAGLAAGAPWGAFAWGGQHERDLPRHLRAASAASTFVYAGSVAAAASRTESAGLIRVRTAYTILYAVGTVVNAASRSARERLLWTPVAGALAVSFWRLRREPVL